MNTIPEQRKLSDAEEARLEKALVRLVGSTKRSRRVKNLIDISKEVVIAEELLGSRKNVAKKIGISEEMLREFARINKLDKIVKRMIKDGHLTSIDVAYRLTMLPEVDQKKVARAYVEKELSTKDVRDVVAFYKKNPKLGIQETMKRIKDSRDIIHYVIKFRLNQKKGIRILRQRFSQLIGRDNIVSLEVDGRVAKLIMSEKGRIILQREAKKRGMTKRKLVRIVTEV